MNLLKSGAEIRPAFGPPVGGDACVVPWRRFCVLQRQRGASPAANQDSRRWPTAMALVAILGLAVADTVADQPTPKSGQSNRVRVLAQGEAGERSDAADAKEAQKRPDRPWWDTEPGPPDAGMGIPLSSKQDGDGLLDLENGLRRRAEMILRELVELPAGQDAQARRLESELKRVREEINRLHKDFGGPNLRPEEPAPSLFELLGERLELTQRAIDIQCLIYELGDEDEERVADLDDELKGINARLKEIVTGHPELEKDREFLRLQLEFHRRAVQRMRQAGKPEAVERFMRDQAAIVGRMENSQMGLPANQRADLDRRRAHVKAAIENLRAAGLDAFAESLAQELRRMVDDPRRQGPGFPAPPGRVEPPEMLEAPHPSQGYEPDRALLHRQIDGMRREMDELRGLVEKLSEQNRRRDGD